MGVGRRVVLAMVVVGLLVTGGGYYLFCLTQPVPSLAKKVQAVVDSSPNPNVAEEQLREIIAKEEGLISVEVEGFGQSNTLVLKKELLSEEPEVRVSLPCKQGVITVGLNRGLFFKQMVGGKIIIFGILLTLVLSGVALFLLQGVNERILSIAAYLKEAELEEIDEMAIENWPAEIKQLVASIDILLKRVEKRLKLKIEEARRDRLFMHNAMVELVECLNQAAQGDLRVRAETPADIVGALGEAFNDSVEILEKRISDAQRVIHELEKAFEGGCNDIGKIKEELNRAKRTLFYFKTGMSPRIDSGGQDNAGEENAASPAQDQETLSDGDV